MDVFAPEFRGAKNMHLRNFYVIVPPLVRQTWSSVVDFIDNEGITVKCSEPYSDLAKQRADLQASSALITLGSPWSLGQPSLASLDFLARS